MNLKNKHGINMIELLLVVFIFSSMSLAFAGFYKFLNVSKGLNSLKTINQSFDKIENIIKSQSCNSFIGRTLKESDIPIPTIGDRQNLDVYVSTESPIFDKDKHAIGEDIFIKNIRLTPPQVLLNDYSVLKVNYLYGEGQVKVKKTNIFIARNANKVITNCFDNFCKTKYMIPKESPFSVKCDGAIKKDNQKATEWIKNNPNGSIKTPSIPHLLFDIPKLTIGSSVRKVITKSYPNSPRNPSSAHCMCIGVFTCYHGFLSHALQCFEIEASTVINNGAGG